MNADRAAASSNRRWLGPLIAVLGAAFPPLFLRVAALDVGPYGGIAPVDWLRIGTATIAGLTVIVLVAALVWRLSRLRFLTALLPATVVYWALAFFWRANLAVADLVSLPGQVGTALLLAVLFGVAWLLVRAAKTTDGPTGNQECEAISVGESRPHGVAWRF